MQPEASALTAAAASEDKVHEVSNWTRQDYEHQGARSSHLSRRRRFRSMFTRTPAKTEDWTKPCKALQGQHDSRARRTPRKMALLNGSYKQNLRFKSHITSNTTDETSQGVWLYSPTVLKGTAQRHKSFLSSSARGTSCMQISLP